MATFVLYSKYWRDAIKSGQTIRNRILTELQADSITFDSITLTPADARVTNHKHVRPDHPRYPCCILVDIQNHSKPITIDHDRIADIIGEHR